MATIAEINLTDWRQIYDVAEALPQYLFRGQADSSWDLTTSLERALKTNAPWYSSKDPLRDAPGREYWMLHEFRKRCHLYPEAGPVPSSKLEWLALMQHHGSPTRLLDFTHSIYIATYFALLEGPGESAVWAVCSHNLRRRILDHLAPDYDDSTALKDAINQSHIKVADRYIGVSWHETPAPDFVVYAEPTTSNRRLSLQQGTFLVPTNVQKSFADNLYAAFGAQSREDVNVVGSGLRYLQGRRRLMNETDPVVPSLDILPDMVRIKLGPLIRRDGVRDLSRMNLSAESLFGGLDGLARSLTQWALLK